MIFAPEGETRPVSREAIVGRIHIEEGVGAVVTTEDHPPRIASTIRPTKPVAFWAATWAAL